MARVAFAPAKLNLYLHVGAPGEDGYHPLCSLMAFADLGDLVSTFEAEALSLRVRGPFAGSLGSHARGSNSRAAQGRRRLPLIKFLQHLINYAHRIFGLRLSLQAAATTRVASWPPQECLQQPL